METTKNDITILIPVHELNDETKPLFDNAIKSIQEQTILPEFVKIIVNNSNTELVEYIQNYNFGELTYSILLNNGNTDFASQINLGVDSITTEWFSILEVDDEYSKIWLKNVIEYREAYKDVETFLPIVIDVDTNGAFLGLTNEAVWALDFSTEMGILDNNSLLAYQNFNFCGMVMKKSTYQTWGGIKESFKLTFIYEFFLRMTYNGVKMMTIPKYGYKHVNLRENSLFSSYKESLSQDEARWWMSHAKKEYFYVDDRGITYKK